MNIAELLSQQGRKWHADLGASEEDIQHLQKAFSLRLPHEYLELLRFSNGGAGPLALDPMYLCLYPVADVVSYFNDEWTRERFPGYIFFASNGGLESIAFDTHWSPPWPIVMIDRIAGTESARVIASDMPTFIQAIGLEFPD